MANVTNVVEILPKISTPEYGARALQTTDRQKDRQTDRQTDGRAISYSERERWVHVRYKTRVPGLMCGVCAWSYI